MNKLITLVMFASIATLNTSSFAQSNEPLVTPGNFAKATIKIHSLYHLSMSKYERSGDRARCLSGDNESCTRNLPVCLAAKNVLMVAREKYRGLLTGLDNFCNKTSSLSDQELHNQSINPIKARPLLKIMHENNQAQLSSLIMSDLGSRMGNALNGDQSDLDDATKINICIREIKNTSEELDQLIGEF